MPGARMLSSLNSRTPPPPPTNPAASGQGLTDEEGEACLGKFPFSPSRAGLGLWQSILPSGDPRPDPSPPSPSGRQRRKG